MTDRDRVEAFRDVVGFGTIREVPPPRAHPHWQTCWKWRVGGGEHIVALYEMFRWWLGPRRREQFKDAITKFNLHARKGLADSRPCPNCGHSTTPGPMVLHRRKCDVEHIAA